MGEITNHMLEMSASVWNTFVTLAVQLFQVDAMTDPRYSGIISIIQTCYNVIIDIAVPIAIIFFLIAIIKDVEFAPAERQPQAFWSAVIKFAIILGFTTTSWTILKYIMSAANALCQSLAVNGNYLIDYNSSTIKAVIDNYYSTPLLDGFSLPQIDTSALIKPSSINPIDFVNECLDYVAGYMNAVCVSLFEALGTFIVTILTKCIFVPLAGFLSIFIMAACGISIISSAAQRIIKPLVLIPFASIGIAMGAGSGDYSRQASQFIKYYIGLCLSGCFMIVALNLGAALCSSSSMAFTVTSGGSVANILATLIQYCIMPIITSGLIKAMDSVVSHAFG